MMKRIFAFIMALVLVVGMLPAPAYAEETQTPEETQAVQETQATEETEAAEEPEATEATQVTEATQATEAPQETEAAEETEATQATEAPAIQGVQANQSAQAALADASAEDTTDYEAEIDGQQYATLADAVSADRAGDTVKLLADAALTAGLTISKNLTLDLNGQTISWAEGATATTTVITVNAGAELTVKDSGTDGQIVGSTAQRTQAIVSNGKLTIEGGQISGWAAVELPKGGELTMTGGSVQGSYYGVAVGWGAEYPATATISGGEVYGAYAGVELEGGDLALSGDAKISSACYGVNAWYDTGIEMTGGTISVEQTGETAFGVCINGGTANLSGGKISVSGTGTDTENTMIGVYATAPKKSTGSTVDYSANVTLNGTDVTVSGNTSTYTAAGVYVSTSYSTAEAVSLTVKEGATVTVTGGTSAALGICQSGYNTAVSVDGGTFEVKSDAETVKSVISTSTSDTSSMTVSGGTFSDAVDEEYCADGFVPTEKEDGSFGVEEDTSVAQVGGIKYESLQEAIEAAGTNDTVKLLADIQLDATVTIAAGKTVTLDLNGKAITVGYQSGSETNHIYAFENNGTFTLTDSSEKASGSITARGVKNCGTMVMNGGTIVVCDTNGGYGIWNDAATSAFTMNGGTVKVTHVGYYVDKAGPTALGNTNASAKMTITGGTIKSVSARTYAVDSVGNLIIAPTEGKTVKVYAPRALSIRGGEATINGGTFETYDAGIGVAAEIYYPLYVAGGNVTVNGGTFTTPESTTDRLAHSIMIDSTTAEIKLNGGTYSESVRIDSKTADLTKSADVELDIHKGFTWSEDGTLTPVPADPTVWDGISVDTAWADAESYVIDTAAELAGLAKLVNEGTNFSGKTVKLGANIDLANKEWTPIGTEANPFAGNFDGQNYTISNLYINQSEKSYQGLFGRIKNNAESKVTFANVTLTNVNVTGKNYVAGLIADAFCVDITNCHVNGDINIVNADNYNYTGAIAGHAYANFLNCSARDTGTDGNGKIQGCYSGGIAGWTGEANSFGGYKIENCHVENIDFVEESGTIVGLFNAGVVIKDCTAKNCTIDANTGSGTGYAGLIAGDNRATSSAPNGVLNSSIENVTGTVTVSGVKQELTQVIPPKTTSVVGTDVVMDENNKIVSGNFSAISETVADKLLADGYKLEKNDDGTYGVVAAAYVAQIGDKKYTSLQAAIDDAKAGETIKLLADITLTNACADHFVVNKEVTIDLMGKTVTGSGCDGVFQVISGGKLTINATNGGTVTALRCEHDYALAVWATKGGEVVINGGTYNQAGDGYNAGDYTQNSYNTIYVSESGKATINGGHFECKTPELTLNIKDADRNSCSIVVTGGTFYKFNPSDNVAEGDHTNFCAQGYVGIPEGDNYKVIELTNWLDVADTSWYDASETEFTITTPEQLAGLAKLVNAGNTFKGKTITLTAAIDLSGSKYGLTELGWPGIGVYSKNMSTNAFQGIFDGAGKKITNVTFADNTGASYAAGDPNNYRGFFNQIGNATVKKLTVSGKGFESGISGEYGAAMIVGHAYNSTIESCVSEGTLTGTHNVAGIVVRIKDTTVKNCTNKANVSGSYSKLGGIVCLTQNSQTGCTIVGCVNEGDVTSSARGEDGVGGIVAYIGYPDLGLSGTGSADGIEVTIQNCENKGMITGTSTALVGQIVGMPHHYWNIPDGNKGRTDILAIGTENQAAFNYATVEGDIATYTNTLTAGNEYLVTAKGAKPVIALAPGQSITFDTALAAIDATGITSANGPAVTTTTEGTKTTYAVVLTNWIDVADTSWYGDGSADTFEIDSAEELAGLAKLVNAGNTFSGKTVKLTAAIDLSGSKYGVENLAWTPIGTDKDHTFQGTFDGQSNTISNLTVSGGNFVGLFGYVINGTLKDVKVNNATVTATGWYAGTIAGAAKESTITNCDVTGKINVSGVYVAGGVVGLTAGTAEKADTIISDCDVSGDVSISSVWYVGGIAGGYATCFDIINCTVTGTAADPAVITAAHYAGGILGHNNEGVTIKTCSVEYVSVIGSYCTGGIAGMSNATTIIGCSVKNSSLTTNDSAGNDANANLVGSIVGTNNTASGAVTKLYNNTTDSEIPQMPMYNTDGAENKSAFVGTGVVLNENNKVTAGVFTTYDVAYESKILAPGCVGVQNTDGTWTVMTAVASITKDGVTTNFGSLQAAIDAAAADDTITLLTDVTITADQAAAAIAASVSINKGTTGTEAPSGFMWDADNILVVKTLTFSGTNMTLGNTLALNFRLKVSDFDAAEVAADAFYARITRTDYKGTKSVVDVKSSEWLLRSNNTRYSIQYTNIAAKEMTDIFEVQIFRTVGDIAVTDVRTDSIRDYAMRVLENSKDSKEKTLVVDMLNYGAAAQVNFRYNTADLVNAQLTADHLALGTATVTTTNNQMKGDNYKSTSLLLEENIAVRLYFNNITNANRNDLYAVITYTDHYNEKQSIRIEGKNFSDRGTAWGPSIDTLVVADWKVMLDCTVYNADGTVFGSVKDSVESYLNRGYANTTNANEKKLFDATMKFCSSSYAYLH